MIFLYITATYFYPLYNSFPYLWFNGEKGRGKSTAGKLIEALAFNGCLSVGSSEADFFRSIEQFRPTMVIDEAENLGTRASAEQQWISRVARAGYQKGPTVGRRNVDDYDKREEFSVYCPKVFINIHGLEDVLADRAIPVTMTMVPNDIQSQLRGFPINHPEMIEMRDKFYILMMSQFKRYREYINIDISSIATLRHAEIFLPILATAKFVDDQTDANIYNVMIEYTARKKAARDSNSDETPEDILKHALVALCYKMQPKDHEGIPTEEFEVNAANIRFMMGRCTADSVSWCNESWVGRNLKKLGIIDAGDSKRVRNDNPAGCSQSRYYRIRPERVGRCIQDEWEKYRGELDPEELDPEDIPPF